MTLIIYLRIYLQNYPESPIVTAGMRYDCLYDVQNPIALSS